MSLAGARVRNPVRLLEVGPGGIRAATLQAALATVFAGGALAAGRDCNSCCYRIDVRDDSGALVPLIAKVARRWRGRTNPDDTFAHEARVLRDLGRCHPTVRGVPAFVARAHCGTAFCLLMTRHPGTHPHPVSHELTAARLASILDAALCLDRIGFQHYDLKLTNILVDGERAAFCDFEFGRFEGTRRLAAADRAAHRYASDFNAWPNPHLRARCNGANFEFRGLASWLRCAWRTGARTERLVFFAGYLRVRSRYHLGLAGLLREAAASGAENSRCLERAAQHEESMGELLVAPSETVASVELALVNWRCAVFFGDARRVQSAFRAVTSALDAASARRARGVPGWYLHAVAGAVERIGAAVPQAAGSDAGRSAEDPVRHMPSE